MRSRCAGICALLPGRKKPARWQGEFWSLTDVNMRAYPGEIVGIVGKNGRWQDHVAQGAGRDLRRGHRSRRSPRTRRLPDEFRRRFSAQPQRSRKRVPQRHTARPDQAADR